MMLVITIALIAITAFSDYELHLESIKYEELYAQYSALSKNYSNLKNQYESLQSQYNSLQNEYNNLENSYTNLQNQYATLQYLYNSLQNESNEFNEYQNALNSLGQLNGSVNLQSFDFKYLWVVVPRGFDGIINISISATSAVNLYVFNLTNFMNFYSGQSYSYYLYDYGSNLNDQVNVGPGLYIIVIYNTNLFEVSCNYIITTTYQSVS